jgi:hypothetical protein
MDLHGISADDQFLPYLRKQEQALADAKNRDGELPKDRRAAHVLSKFDLCKLSQQIRDAATANQLTIMLLTPHPPSATSWDQLQQIYFRDMQIAKRHYGKYLLIRALTPPNRNSTIMAIVEDQKGDATFVQLFHQDPEEIRPAASVITTGEVFLPKEPFFWPMVQGECGRLYVYHVSDIIRITARHEMQALIPKEWRLKETTKYTANDWKLKGNKKFETKNYWSAIER